jgi:hypothetical protein
MSIGSRFLVCGLLRPVARSMAARAVCLVDVYLASTQRCYRFARLP